MTAQRRGRKPRNPPLERITFTIPARTHLQLEALKEQTALTQTYLVMRALESWLDSPTPIESEALTRADKRAYRSNGSTLHTISTTIEPDIKAHLDKAVAQTGYNRSRIATKALEIMLADPIPFLPKIMTKENNSHDRNE